MSRAIIGIDPGASGGIATFVKGRATAVKMPSDVFELNEYLRFLIETYETPLVFIEKVQAFIADDATPGMKFAINKMLANQEQIHTILKLSGIPYVEVYPVSWQSHPYIKCPNPNAEKPERKKHYASIAQTNFPEVKVTLATGDALCLIIFGTYKLHNDINWVIDKVQNGKSVDLRLFV